METPIVSGAADEKFMNQALGLASQGRGAVEPNPMVGALIVKNGVVVAQGLHERFGYPHAEANAIKACAPQDLRGSTVYVTLEPCCHLNKKTPPCAQALITAGVSRVVVAMEDPDENVSGRGVQMLRAAGVEVSVGVGRNDASALLAPYVKLRTQHRPWVILKWAQTADGYLSLPPQAGRWITNDASRGDVHKLRSLCDGICVGVKTVLADDPLLNNRSGHGRQPTRVVLDSTLATPCESRLVKSVDTSPVIIATSEQSSRTPNADRLRQAGVEILPLPSGPGGIDLGAFLDSMGRRNWTHLIIEGGGHVLRSFHDLGLGDEYRAYIAPIRRGDAGDGPRFALQDVLSQGRFSLIEHTNFDGDKMFIYRTKSPPDTPLQP